jgi:glucose/arabinose dehydrogenase
MRPRQTALGLVLTLSFALAPKGASAQALAAGAPADLLNLEDDYVGGLSQPTALEFLPDGTMVITEKGGAVKLRTSSGSIVTAGQFSVDTGSEKGLLNVLPHPDFEENRLLFFYYSAADGTSTDKHRVVSVKLGTDNQLDMASETILVRDLRGPANHDGGALALDRDKTHLFIGVGDTGCNSNAPPSSMTITNYFGTCLTNGNGKILRVALDGSIPADNPLVGEAQVTACGASCGTAPTTTAEPREDIWAWGFRNPWRIWTDPKTGNLWVGDVGEVTYEEINIVEPEGGKHYGWPFREGEEGAPPSQCTELEPDVGNCVDPVYICAHDANAPDGDCASITGGFILDHCSWPEEFRGRYLFGDYTRNHVFTLEVNAARNGVVAGSRQELVERAGGPVHFTLGPDGAVYYANISGGEIVRISPKNPEPCEPDPGSGGNGAGAAGGGEAGDGAGASGGTGATGEAGTTGATGTSGSAGSAATGGSGSASNGDDDGGCGCRTARGRGATFALGVSLTALLGFSLRRRARAARRGR